MREILFRGKRTDNGKWVEGKNIFWDTENRVNIVPTGELCFLATRDENLQNVLILPRIEVIPETVGQYTGLTDKNGTKIFEGDIVAYVRDEEVGQIAYHESEAMFCVEFDVWLTDFDHMYEKDLEVIGNIHDNPELLKGESDNA